MSNVNWKDPANLFTKAEPDKSGVEFQKAEEERKAALRAKVDQMFGIGPDATAAQSQFGQEDNQMADALRSYYSAEGKKGYDDAERSIRFGAARSGNIGSRTYADTLSRLNEANTTAGTRINEAVQRALLGLKGGRESLRQQTLGMINSGAGNEALSAASGGLNSVIDSNKNAQKEKLFTDLFSGFANAKVAGDQANQMASVLAMLKQNRQPVATRDYYGNILEQQ